MDSREAALVRSIYTAQSSRITRDVCHACQYQRRRSQRANRKTVNQRDGKVEERKIVQILETPREALLKVL